MKLLRYAQSGFKQKSLSRKDLKIELKNQKNRSSSKKWVLSAALMLISIILYLFIFIKTGDIGLKPENYMVKESLPVETVITKKKINKDLVVKASNKVIKQRGTRIIKAEINAGETLSLALKNQGVMSNEIFNLIDALKTVMDLKRIRPGDAFTLEFFQLLKTEIDSKWAVPFQIPKVVNESLQKLNLLSFDYQPKRVGAAPISYHAQRVEDLEVKDGTCEFKIEKTVTPLDTKVEVISGEIHSSLYTAMIEKGEKPALVSAFADIFAWNIDFYRQTQKGDRFKVIVEKKYLDGRLISYGNVKAAEFVNSGRIYRGFKFHSADGKILGIYDDLGDSLERTFLTSPLQISRITSNYGQRFHPVLKRWKSHNGVDYGASRGTPFWSVADGTIVEAKFSATAGNMIVVRHAKGYETQYFHASAFAKGIRVGKKVRQRDVIGYVGTTGRSTGPHLHFGMKRHGHYVAPKKQKFPAAKPLSEKYMPEYLKYIEELQAKLKSVKLS